MSDTTPHHSEPAREAVAVPAGWKLVPVEPTLPMLDAADPVRTFTASRANSIATYRAMLSASPAPAASGGLEAVREALGKPDGWREQREVIEGWTRSAFLAGEKVADPAWHKHELYGDLNRIVQWLRSAEDAASAALAAPAATGGEASSSPSPAPDALARCRRPRE